nr:uncharacterized protein LOC129274633 [Lytechinus pictus]
MAGTKYLRLKLLFISGVSLAVGSVCWQFTVNGEGRIWQKLITGLFGAIYVLLAVISLWMSAMRISYGHCLKSAYTQVLFITPLMLLNCYSKYRPCEKAWKNPKKSQEEYLKRILMGNINTEYVKRFGLDSVTSLAELREKHPLSMYERYRPFVDRAGKGEKGIMVGGDVVRFALTSGTTGKAKMVPYSKSYRRIISALLGLNLHARINSFGFRSPLQREMFFYTAPKPRYTEAGIRIGPASMIPPSMKPALVIYSTPGEGFQVEDPDDALYVHLIFGLRDPNLHAISCSFTSTVMSAMKMLEQRWPVMVCDIMNGTVTTTRVPAEIHEVLFREMGYGDPVRAAELKREFEQGFEGIVKRLWPCLKFIQCSDTVGIKQRLLETYAKGVLIFSRTLGSTEAGMLAVNLWPLQEKDEFVLLPHMCVFEFIPEDKMHDDEPKTLFIDELEIGASYEIAITQLFGLYRFRYGDVVKVTRYHFNTPVVQFMYRSGQILNVKYEKLDQAIVKNAIQAAVNHWPNVTLDDYAVAESFLLDDHEKGAKHLPFYIVFLEISPTPGDSTFENIKLNKVDEELRQHSSTYNMFREDGSIAPPLVHIVKPGTFDRLYHFILDNSTTTANQYKVPRKLRTKETLKLMQDNSVHSNEV